MLQKTKKGHKMEDQWTGPYTVEEVDLHKGTCRLRGKSGDKLRRIVNMKDLKAYTGSNPQLSRHHNHHCSILIVLLSIQRQHPNINNGGHHSSQSKSDQVDQRFSVLVLLLFETG